MNFSEVFQMAKLGWILEKLGKNFRQYFNAKNPKQHKTVVDADPTNTWQVGASSDDCYRKLVSSGFSLTESYCYCGDYSSAHYDFSSGVRFTNVNIPQGSIINSAYLKLKAQLFYGAIPETFIEGENSDNAATFSTAADYDGRPRTSANVSWTPSDWVQNTWYNSSDIKTVIQEIVNRVGWASGNALVLFWRDAPGWGGALKRVDAWSYNGGAANAPKLEVTWEEGAPPVSAGILVQVM